MDDFKLTQCVMLRGLGYTHQEIAEKLGLKLHQVQYSLTNLNDEARLNGDEAVYLRVLSAGFGPRILRIIEKLGSQ